MVCQFPCFHVWSVFGDAPELNLGSQLKQRVVKKGRWFQIVLTNLRDSVLFVFFNLIFFVNHCGS